MHTHPFLSEICIRPHSATAKSINIPSLTSPTLLSRQKQAPRRQELCTSPSVFLVLSNLICVLASFFSNPAVCHLLQGPPPCTSRLLVIRLQSGITTKIRRVSHPTSLHLPTLSTTKSIRMLASYFPNSTFFFTFFAFLLIRSTAVTSLSRKQASQTRSCTPFSPHLANSLP